ncbi:MAG: TIGR02217 family protein [Tabrizicola flagellatus]|uniref:phage distal tail protein, Rcc01695 family n=1 Tax=Tabrizicola flagellatus TaxID=2593021 RepID=UPI00391B07FA
MAFHEIRFPANLSFGSVGGPERRTEIVTLANGFEERNTPWQHSRRRYDAGVGLRSLNDVETLIAFFEARAGQLHGFRWKDWSDYKSCAPLSTPAPDDQLVGIGDGATTVFRLSKTYVSGLQSYTRPLLKPVEGTVLVAIEGDQKIEGLEFSVNSATGEVTFALPPDIGTRITAGFEFDVPVRFDTDTIQTSVASFQAGDVPTVPVVEIRL